MNRGSIISLVCDQMNEWASARAAHYEGQDHAPGEAAQLALDDSVQHFDLTLIMDWESCEIYRTQEGDLINCWRDAPYSALIESGGVGFDEQIEWYEEVLNDRAEREQEEMDEE